ncbi:MAG: hypothetical protein AB8H12_13085 [Lewinella sp.]
MKTKHLLLYFFLAISILCISNCEKDEVDITVGITGEYLGTYGANPNIQINPYAIVVTKINNSLISVSPKSGNEFDTFEFELEMINSSTISLPVSQTQGIQNTATFSLSIPPTFTFALNLTDEAHTFVGEKQE